MKNALDLNFIVDTPLSEPDDARLFSMEQAIHVPITTSMLDILVRATLFPSKSEARKNWKGPIEIPGGFFEFQTGKMKHRITILKVVDPSEIVRQALPNSRVEDKRIDNVA